MKSQAKPAFIRRVEGRCAAQLGGERAHQAAAERGQPFALVTDLYCPWAREWPADLLQVKTDVGQFWDSLAPLTCLFNLLITAVVDRLGPAIDRRVARNRELQRTFDQFES